MTTPTNAQVFAQAGEALFGAHWPAGMASLLGWPLDERGQNRTTQRIRAAASRGEDYRIAPGVWQEIAQAIRVRAGHLDQVRRLAEDLAQK